MLSSEYRTLSILLFVQREGRCSQMSGHWSLPRFRADILNLANLYLFYIISRLVSVAGWTIEKFSERRTLNRGMIVSIQKVDQKMVSSVLDCYCPFFWLPIPQKGSWPFKIMDAGIQVLMSKIRRYGTDRACLEVQSVCKWLVLV